MRFVYLVGNLAIWGLLTFHEKKKKPLAIEEMEVFNG